MNNRGDIPVMILVIGVVAICGLAIFSFISFKKLSDENSLEEGLYLFEQIDCDLEKFYFYTNDKIDFTNKQAAEMIDAKIVGGKLVIEKEAGRVGIRYEIGLS